MQFDFAAKELTIKLVYYGPALSGKTTNLQSLHLLASAESRGRLMTLETRDDRTLFFDMLPLTFASKSDISIRIKLFTVPGQVIHGSTRRLVLQGADGVAFVADSQLSETENNATAFVDLRENLKANGMKVAQLPLVIQFNKRDLPSIRSDAELAELARKGKEPVFPAVAMSNKGVLETFLGLLHLTYSSLDAEHRLREKFGLAGPVLVADVAKKLGSKIPAEQLLRSSLGGALDVLTAEKKAGA
ncbi:MAG TPA: GTPase domain-containing protein [Polyangiaceae bacterium]|nr:GTPase domain-containing protein [Polyangiaceae bacterium]